MILSTLSLLLVFSRVEDQTYFLDQLDLSGMTQGWNSPMAKKSVEGNSIKLRGETFERGVGTHSVSRYILNLGGKGKLFSATVGVDDEVKDRGSVVFEVYVDKKRALQTKVLKGNGETAKVNITLTGAKTLELVVDDAGDGMDYDHADWADAKLTMMAGAKMPKAVVVPKLPPPPIAGTNMKVNSINGPRVVGTTPGRPFLFRIPATGPRPMKFTAKNLPAGLVLDPQAGIISGSVKGDWSGVVTLVAKGKGGTSRRELRIVAGEHKLAQTPPMGWNSWNVWAGAVDAAKVKDAADQFIKTGLADHGYTYVNIDDCWEAGRDSNGMIQSNQKFPNMESLANYVHGLGLKIGLYSSPGPKTCAGFEASYKHEFLDAKQYANWGFDYLKYDWCSYGSIAKDNSLFELQKPYRLMREALDQVNRDIVFSFCQYGMGDVWKWGKDCGGNLWRTTGDITDSWSSLDSIGFAHSDRSPYVQSGGWNDPDMLVVGKLGWGPQLHNTNLTPNEQLTHISLWSLLAAPLLIGCDLTQIDTFTLNLLTNDEVIDIDQDPLGKAATRRWKKEMLEVWARPLFDGTMAVGLFNRGREDAPINVNWSVLGLKGPQQVRDLWYKKNVGKFPTGYKAQVPAHGVVLIKARA